MLDTYTFVLSVEIEASSKQGAVNKMSRLLKREAKFVKDAQFSVEWDKIQLIGRMKKD